MKNSTQQLSITIGIPTCYGGVPLLPTIESIRQSENVTVEQIIVIADQKPLPKDIMTRLKELNVEVVWNDIPENQPQKLKAMLKIAKGDILVMTQDDVIFEKGTLSEILATFTADKGVTMVGTVIHALTPLTPVESALGIMVKISDRVATIWNHGDNYLSASGRCCSFRTDFLRTFRIPDEIVNLDTYLYFENMRLGGLLRRAQKSIAYTDQPKTLHEQVGPSSRYQISRMELQQFFSYDLKPFYHIPFFVALRAVIVEFIYHPFRTILYVMLFLYTRLRPLPQEQALATRWNRSV